MATYQSQYTGQQIDAAVAFGMTPDTTPTANSTKGVTSGGVYAETSVLKSNSSEVGKLFSDGSTLLSNSLTNKDATSVGVSYSLVGNTITLSGTSRGDSFFAVLGTTTSAPPSWLVGGKSYVVTIQKTTGGRVQLQGKQASDTTMHNFALYADEGRYIFTPPADITVFRVGIFVATGTTVSGTITIEMSNAISPIDVENELSEYLALSSDKSVMIADYTDFDTLTTPGTYKVTSNAHAATMTHMPNAIAGKLIVIEKSQTMRLTQMYFDVSDESMIYYRGYNANGWTTWSSLVKSNQYQWLVGKINALATPLTIQYVSGSWGDATARIDVWIPASNGLIQYRMYKFTDIDDKCDGWQMHHAYHTDDDFTNSTDLTISGEWECAIHLAGRGDFSGGHTHGDEMMSAVTFLVDGEPTDITTLTNKTACRELKIIQTSVMYDPADHTTQIAKHGKEYVFGGDGLTINQSLEWLVAETLTDCFMCMFLPSKNYIDRAAANSDFEVITLATSTSEHLSTVVKSRATAVDMWDTSSKFSASISTPIYPTGLTGGDQISISDNITNDYNKLYFKVCGGGSSAVGELWKSTSVYKLDFA